MRIRINKDLLVAQIMWLTLILRVSVFERRVWMFVELIGISICLIYIVLNINKIEKRDFIPIVLLVISYWWSTVLNRNENGLYISTLAVIYAMKIFCIFSVIWIVVKKKSLSKVVGSLWNASFLYWIPSIISVFIQGRNVIDNASDTYFIGNKFQVVYLNVVMFCFLRFLNIKSLEKKWNLNYISIGNISIKLFYIVSLYMALYMKAYTGFLMMIFILVISLIAENSKKILSFFGGRSLLIQSPKIVLTAILLSGVILVVFDILIQIPIISRILETIGKTGTIHSRLLIYKNLAEIIQQKPWWGYGHGSAIVSTYYGPNAQNGLMQLLIHIGVLGTFFFFIMVWKTVKMGRVRLNITINFLYGVFAFVMASTVEVTYNLYFISCLALYSSVKYDLLGGKCEKNGGINQCNSTDIRRRGLP